MFLSINCLRLCLFLGAEAVPGGTTVARLGKMYSSDCVPLIFPPDFFRGKRPGPKRKIPPECFSLSRMKSGILDKLTVLAESAKYDVSCASSGVTRRHREGGVGSASGWGICHTFTADRALRFAAQDHADEPLRLRLRLLHQPPQQRHPPGLVHGRRAGRSDDRVLPPQLHRGPVSQFRVLRNPDYTMERMVRWFAS